MSLYVSLFLSKSFSFLSICPLSSSPLSFSCWCVRFCVSVCVRLCTCICLYMWMFTCIYIYICDFAMSVLCVFGCGCLWSECYVYMCLGVYLFLLCLYLCICVSVSVYLSLCMYLCVRSSTTTCGAVTPACPVTATLWAPSPGHVTQRVASASVGLVWLADSATCATTPSLKSHRRAAKVRPRGFLSSYLWSSLSLFLSCLLSHLLCASLIHSFSCCKTLSLSKTSPPCQTSLLSN